MPLAITYSIDHRTEICETTIHGAARIDRWIRNASVRIEQPTLVEYVVLHCAAANNNREFGRRHSIFHAKANWIGFEDGLWATGRHVSLSVRPAYMARATCFAKVRRIGDPRCVSPRSPVDRGPIIQNKNVKHIQIRSGAGSIVHEPRCTSCFVRGT